MSKSLSQTRSGAVAQAAVAAAAYYVELFDTGSNGKDVLIEKIGGLSKREANDWGSRHVSSTNGVGSFTVDVELCDRCQSALEAGQIGLCDSCQEDDEAAA